MPKWEWLSRNNILCTFGLNGLQRKLKLMIQISIKGVTNAFQDIEWEEKYHFHVCHVWVRTLIYFKINALNFELFALLLWNHWWTWACPFSMKYTRLGLIQYAFICQKELSINLLKISFHWNQTVLIRRYR